VFEESHQVEIAGAIKLLSNRKQTSGEGEAKKKPEEKGLADKLSQDYLAHCMEQAEQDLN
jgi:hypothetical protein